MYLMDAVEEERQPDGGRKAGGAREQSVGQHKKSYDTLGTIPRIRADTATVIHGGDKAAYFTRSVTEADAFRRRGETAFRNGRHAESVRAFTLAIDIMRKMAQEDDGEDGRKQSAYYQELARLLFRRGCSRFRQGGEGREAVHDLDQSLAIRPTQPLAYLQKGQALLEMQEHAAASRTFLGGLRFAPRHGELRRLFELSIRGVRGNSQRYVPEWRGMAGEKPLNGADDGWIPHKLPVDIGRPRSLVDSYQSREDPMVCAALIEANAYLDLDDVLDAERNFWKKTGVSCKRDDLRGRLQHVLADFKDVLITLFSAYCTRESGLKQLAIVRKTTAAASTATKPGAVDVADPGKKDGNVGCADEEESGRAENSSSDDDDDDDSSDSDQSYASVERNGAAARKCGVPSVSAFLDPVSPSRLQRVGKQGCGGNARATTALDGGGAKISAEEFGYKSFMESRCMNGAQFLDFVNDCTILEGAFLWEEAAKVVHRVCRSGRTSNSERSRQIINSQERPSRNENIADNHDAPKDDASQRSSSQDESEATNPDAWRSLKSIEPQSEKQVKPSRPTDDHKDHRPPPHRQHKNYRRKHQSRRNRRDKDPGPERGKQRERLEGGKSEVINSDAQTPEDKLELPLGKNGEDFVDGSTLNCQRDGGVFVTQPLEHTPQMAPVSTIAGTGEGDAPNPSSEVGHTDGMNNPETNMDNNKSNSNSNSNNKNKNTNDSQDACHEQKSRTMSKEVAFLRVTEDTEGAEGGPMLFPEFVEALTRLCLTRYGPLAPVREVPGVTKAGGKGGARGAGGRSTSGRGSASGSTRKVARGTPPVSVGLAMTHHRLRFAIEKHLLPQVVNVSQAETRRVEGEISVLMQRYTMRLEKIFAYFAVGGPSTVPTPVSEHEPETAPDPEREASERSDPIPARLRGCERRREGLMSEREFVGMLRSLEVLDARLTLREACRICVSVMGIVAAWGGGVLEEPKSPNRAVNTTSTATSAVGGTLAPLSVGENGMGPKEFTFAIYHCGDVKTWDGMCPVSQRIESFVLHDLCERFLLKTGESTLWWTR